MPTMIPVEKPLRLLGLERIGRATRRSFRHQPPIDYQDFKICYFDMAVVNMIHSQRRSRREKQSEAVMPGLAYILASLG
jgi:hypothetical protein